MQKFKEIPRVYILGGIGALIVILLAVTLLNPSHFRYQNTTDYAAAQKQAALDRQQYQQLLATVDVSTKDSQVLLQKIATEDVVKQEVADSMQLSQKIVVPDIPDSAIKIAPRGDKQALVSYFKNFTSIIQDYNNRTNVASQVVFTPTQDSSVIAEAARTTDQAVASLKQLPVPGDAVAYHKAQIVAMQQYSAFLGTAAKYNPQALSEPLTPRGESANQPWPEVYKDYAIINTKAGVVTTESHRLDQKYGLGKIGIGLAVGPAGSSAGASADQAAGPGLFGLIRPAHAFLGIGDTTIVLGDLPAIAFYGIRQGLLKAFSTFIVKAIDKLVAKIDKYFTITSQLYYSQELGKLYTKEYWTKFNVAQADQAIMQNFLPDYFCANSVDSAAKLKDVFAAKSKQLLQYDINAVPLNSPNFYTALAELGTAAQTNPQAYWSDYYSTFALKSQAAAQDAATKEVTSTGVKSGRDLITGQVDKTLSQILDVQQGSVSAALNLGNTNADNIISTLVAGIFDNLTTKFIFTATSSGQRGGGLATLQENSLCIGTAKYQPVIPGTPDPKDIQAAHDAQVQACQGLIQAAASSSPAANTTGQSIQAVQDCQNLVNQGHSTDNPGGGP